MVFGFVGTICAIVFGWLAFRRNSKTDDAEEGKKDGVILTEIGYIKSSVDDIKQEQKQQNKQYVEIVSRITAVEESAKQSHHRIDDHDERISILERSIK